MDFPAPGAGPQDMVCISTRDLATYMFLRTICFLDYIESPISFI